MNNQELNTALYEKLFAEQEKFKGWLLTQPPSEILNHAYEYVKDVDYKELEAGDVITFMLDEDTVATHRITEVVPDEEEPDTLRYRTKGDANDAEDGKLVHYKNVIGSPVFTIPYLGYFADYIQNPPGTYVAISVGAVLLLLVFLPDLFSSDDKDKEKKKTKGRYERDHIPKQ